MQTQNLELPCSGKQTVLQESVLTHWNDYTLGFTHSLGTFKSKRQSLSPTVLFRTTLTRTITLDKLLILPGSNHLLNNSLYKDYSKTDDYTRQTTDTPGLKAFTKQQCLKGYTHPHKNTRQNY